MLSWRNFPCRILGTGMEIAIIIEEVAIFCICLFDD